MRDRLSALASALGALRLRRALTAEPGPTAAVVVDHVEPAGATPIGGDGSALLGAALDEPRAGREHSAFAIALTGWALGREAPVDAIEMVVDRMSLARLPVTRERPEVAAGWPSMPHAVASGFTGLAGALDLPRRFEASLEAVWANGERCALWTLRGRRAPVVTQPVDGIQPIVIRAMARTGSTWLTRLLGAHPEVVTYRPFEYEPRLLSFWMEVLRALGDPAVNVGVLRPPGTIDPQWWLGVGDAPEALPAEDERLHVTLGRESVEHLAIVGRERVEAFYTALAEREGKRARYFVEKGHGMRRDFPKLWRLADEIHAGAHQLFLFRDPRDMVCSMRAYAERRREPGFGRDRFASDEEHVGWLGEGATAMLRDYVATGGRSVLVRYEDLVRAPEAILPEVFSHVGIEAGRAAVDEVLARASVEHPGMAFHRTAGNHSEASIGRWRKELPAHLREPVSTAFAEVLRELGYAEGG
jgi:hypothetical protein